MRLKRGHRVAGVVFLIVLGILTTGSQVAQATTYYVSTTGNDGNPGTQALPWRTLQNAAGTAAAGDVVLVNDGNYSGFLGVRSGTAGNLITFRANGSNVVINQVSQNGQDNINIEGVDYIMIDGFIVEDAGRVGIRVAEAAGVIVQNNTVRRSQWVGIFSGFSPQVQILNNTISGSIEQHGIYLSNSRTADDQLIVRGNESFGNNFSGLQLNGDCLAGGDGIISNALVEQNYLHDNNGKALSLISVQNSFIINNVITENGVLNGAGGIHLTDEPGCGLASFNNVIANNTIVESRIACVRATDGASTNYLFNNIILATGNNSTIVDEVGGNLVDAVSNLEGSSTFGIFVDDAIGNYRLSPSSPAIDMGNVTYLGKNAPDADFDGNPRPQGNAYDAGAFEAGAGPPDAEPPTVAITQPINNADVSGMLTIQANASDNQSVAGVRFLLDDLDVAAEDRIAPYEVVINTGDWTNGSYALTAVARDIAGNATTSTVVTVNITNAPPPPPPPLGQEHPRLFLTPSRMAHLRSVACYDANGNVIPACSPSPEWNIFMNDRIDSGTGEGWEFALAYKVTGNTSYAQTAISAAQSRVDGDIGAVSAADKTFLYVHKYIRDVALVYDWCYDLMPQSQRNAFVAYMHKVIYILWTPGPNAPVGVATQPNSFGFTWSGWATQNPGQNFFSNFILATAYTSIATRFDASFPYALPYPAMGPTYTDPLEFLNIKLDEQMLTWIGEVETGGGWHEGENYGELAKMLLYEAFIVLRDWGERDHFYTTAWPVETAHYTLYAQQPNHRIMYTGGDLARDSGMPVSPYQKFVMLLLAEGLQGTVEGQYAQYWINNVGSTHMWQFLLPFDFLLRDRSFPERDFRELPLDYFAAGSDWANSRSGWDDNAVSVTFTSPNRRMPHMHGDVNAFVIYKGYPGAGLDGWQMSDIQPFSFGNKRHSIYHNTFLINGEAQRFGMGTGDMVRYEAKDGYVYMAGDASDAYWTNGFDFNHGDEKMTDVFIREIVHILPGHVVVYDRLSPTPAFASATVTSLFHHPSSSPSRTGDILEHTHGQGRMFQNILLPSNYNLSIIDERSTSTTWRVELEPGQQQASYQFLNSFYVTDIGTTTQPAATTVTSSANKMVGVKIEESGEDYVVLFSSDPTGTVPVDNVLYEVGVNGRAKHMLYGLIPDAEYIVDVVTEAGVHAIFVSSGVGGYRSSGEGSLVFHVDNNGAEATTDHIVTR